MSISIRQFESEIQNKQYESAYGTLVALLKQLDSGFGHWQDIVCEAVPQQSQHNNEAQEVYIATRLANAISQLFLDDGFQITEAGALELLVYQRWLAHIFAASPYWNADHILQAFNTHPEPSHLNYSLPPNIHAFLKFAVLYLPESNIQIEWDALWEAAPEVCAALAFALQTPRFLGTEHAYQKRHFLLQWFPEKLAQIQGLEQLPMAVSHDVYMHCSYDIAPNKHDVKKALNQVVRRSLLNWKWQDRDVSHYQTHQGKPVMVVLLEHFNGSHSIYRTHSTSIRAARERFYIVGVGRPSVDALGRAVFDEFHELDNEQNSFESLFSLRDICERFGAAVLYMPSIGMDLLTVLASNTRLAPIQAVALGHPATTHSDFIEYVIVEDDYVGSKDCFSEALIRLPKTALPYVPSASAPEKVEYRLREQPDLVQIGIAATTMKLNPYFLQALQVIQQRSEVPLLFHFAVGQNSGIISPYLKRFIQSYLGDRALVYQHMPYQNYLQVLHQCDLMLNPFPFGNTNGIIDMVTLGLVGICKTGPEVHEHIDEALFARLGLPDWLVTKTADEYVEQALRLIHNHEERLALRRDIIEHNRLHTLFSGDASPLGRELWQRFEALKLPEAKAEALPEAKKSKPSGKKNARKKNDKKK